MAENAYILPVRLPLHLKNRALRIAKHWQSNLTQLIREGLALRVEQLEAKEREEREHALREQEAKKNRRLSLAPKPLENNIGERSLSTARPDEIYVEHAKRVLAVLEDDEKRDEAIKAAIAAIKNRHPVTHPGDAAIKTKLEEIIVSLADNQGEAPKPPPPTMAELANHMRTMREEVSALAPPKDIPRRVSDEATGKTIDPSRVKSRGDV